MASAIISLRSHTTCLLVARFWLMSSLVLSDWPHLPAATAASHSVVARLCVRVCLASRIHPVTGEALVLHGPPPACGSALHLACFPGKQWSFLSLLRWPPAGHLRFQGQIHQTWKPPQGKCLCEKDKFVRLHRNRQSCDGGEHSLPSPSFTRCVTPDTGVGCP